MDLEAVRQHIRAAMEADEEIKNPSRLAKKAGVNQGNLNAFLRRTKPTEISARVLFQAIERGLNKSLTDFFAEIESGTHSARTQPIPKPGAAHGDHRVGSTVADADQLVRTVLTKIAAAIGSAATKPTPPASTEKRRSAADPPAGESRGGGMAG